jgi:hypothetical protein
MKKQFISGVLMLQAIIFFNYFLSCKNYNQGTQQNTPGISCSDCRRTETYGHTMEEFLEVTREYREKRWKLINAQLPGMTDKKDSVDSRAIWFSLDSLKKFICTIEKYSEQLHIKPENLGIRMYYAVYKKNPDFQNLHTLFMVPTITANNENAVPQDFDPRSSVLDRNEIKSRDSLITFVDLARYPTKVALIFSREAEASGLIKNNGGLCPPKCPPPTNTLNAIDSDLPH